MKIVIPPIHVERDDSFKDDLFNRKPFGKELLNLISRTDTELVISLDGQWGEGKTTFVKMWQGMLTEATIHSIYIDAFEEDYSNDAFISVASAITQYADENSTEDTKASEFKDKAKVVGGRLLSLTAKIALKAATLGILNDTALDDVKNDITKGTTEVVNSFLDDRFNAHADDKKTLLSFKKILSKLPSQLKDNNDKPLVIIIDELDRCKPTYAVELIEIIKHLFLVKNIIFLLVMNKKQLEQSFRYIYGKDIDAQLYLQKFINIDVTMPKRMGNRYDNDPGKYCRKLLELHELETWVDKEEIGNCIEGLAVHLNLSLRQVEKICTNITLIYSISSERDFRLISIIVFVSTLKIVNNSLLQDLLFRKINYKSLCHEIGIPRETSRTNTHDNLDQIRSIMHWVKFSLLSDEEFEVLKIDDPMKEQATHLARYHINREEILPFFIQKLNMYISN